MTINNYWNKYYFSKEFFQNKINFTKDIQTNYYGDLHNYLYDTLDLVKEFDIITNKNDYLSKSIVLLQIIYVHQDLIDELLYIFKLDRSKTEDKNPNRYIRNELIGHPIRKDYKTNILNSSVLFAFHKELSNDIKYTKYSKENNFSPESKEYKVKDIIKNHMIFLNSYLDKIINKLIQDELKYNKKLISIINIPISKQFDFIDSFDRYLLSRISTVFDKNYLKYYYENITNHKRYAYCIEYYKKALKNIINETNNNKINNIQKREFIEVNIMDLNNLAELSLPKKTIHSNIKKLDKLDKYAIEQLFNKDKIFNIDVFINIYKENQKILDELIHMKKNIDNNREYYASLEYLISF